jgi:hypothetical protein
MQDTTPQPDESRGRKPQVTEYVSDLVPMERQIGHHVMTALGHENTVAVLSAVVVGADGVQRIVSAPLDAEKLAMVQELLESADDEQTQRVSCFGFHCKSPAFDQSGDSGDAPPDVRDDQ